MNHKKGITIWIIISIFYLLQYILRVIPGVLVEELNQKFQLNAKEFSTFSSYYLYSYALIQIPLGLLMDKIGVKKIIIFSITLCVIGALIFACSGKLWMIQVSRLIIGAGSASAFIGALKTCADYFTQEKKGFFIGMTLLIGTLGALISAKPILFLMQFMSWQKVILLIALLGVLILLLTCIFLPFEEIKKQKFNKNLIQDIYKVSKNWKILLFALISVGLYLPISILADLWGTSFLIIKFNLIREQAAQITMLLYVGLAVGCLILPIYCKKLLNINFTIQTCSLLLFLLYNTLLFINLDSIMIISLLMIIIGFFCAGEMICFNGAIISSKNQNTGLIIGFINTFNMLGSAITQYFIGIRLNSIWDGKLDLNGVQLYNIQHFQYALCLVPIIIGIVFIITFFLPKYKE